MRSRLHAEFLGEGDERILLVAHYSGELTGDCLVIVPAFAEEMNKTRRMMAETAQALAARGVAVVYVDLFGTGDSAGSFADATWSRWRADVVSAYEWCTGKGLRVKAFVGIRLGCALALDAAKELGLNTVKFLLWQPVVDGSRAVEQFLRLRVATSLIGDTNETVKDLRARLRSGATVEIAGYPLSVRLAEDIACVRLVESVPPEVEGLHWLEVRQTVDAATAAPTLQAIQTLRSRGCKVHYESLVAEPYWSSNEIVTIPSLIHRTIDILRGAA